MFELTSATSFGGADLRDLDQRSSLLDAVDRLKEAVLIPPKRASLKMHATIAAMHSLCAEIETAEPVLGSATIRNLIQPAFALVGGAPFFRRLQEWPRGYPGDFETIEQLCTGAPALDESDPHFWLEWYGLNTAIAQSYRNKIEFQRTAIFDRLARGGRILSAACGGARDLLLSPSVIEATEVSLIDQDLAGLQLACSRLATARAVNPIHADVLQGMRRLRGVAFDRIVFGGLFDYFSDRAIVTLLRLALGMIRPGGGTIVFTNMGSRSHFRVFIENLTRWPLIYRDETEMRSLAESAGVSPDRLSLTLDATGLSWLATIR